MTNLWYGILCHLKVIALVHELFDTPSYTVVTGRFAQKPVPSGTIRSKTILRTGRFTPGRFAPFVKKNEKKSFFKK